MNNLKVPLTPEDSEIWDILAEHNQFFLSNQYMLKLRDYSISLRLAIWVNRGCGRIVDFISLQIEVQNEQDS